MLTEIDRKYSCFVGGVVWINGDGKLLGGVVVVRRV